MRDLLLAQRVSRKWKAVITENTSLQQKLFLVPRKADFCWLFNPVSPLKWPTQVSRDYKLPADSNKDVLLEQGRVNPLIFETIRCGDTAKQMCEFVFVDCAAMRGGTIVEPRECHQHPAMSFPEASWRRMLFTQPPIKRSDWEGENFKLAGVSRGILSLQRSLTCEDTVSGIGDLYSAESFWMNITDVGMLFLIEHELAIVLAEQDVRASPEEDDFRDENLAFYGLWEE